MSNTSLRRLRTASPGARTLYSPVTLSRACRAPCRISRCWMTGCNAIGQTLIRAGAPQRRAPAGECVGATTGAPSVPGRPVSEKPSIAWEAGADKPQRACARRVRRRAIGRNWLPNSGLCALLWQNPSVRMSSLGCAANTDHCLEFGALIGRNRGDAFRDGPGGSRLGRASTTSCLAAQLTIEINWKVSANTSPVRM